MTAVDVPKGRTRAASNTRRQVRAPDNRQPATMRILVATAGEPATYAFTFTKSSVATAAGIVAYRGVNTTTPVDVHGAQTTTKAVSKATAPSVNVTVAGATLISIFGSAIDATAAAPTGMTERYDRLSVGSSGIAVAADD